MITQTKDVLALFKDGKLHVVVECPGTTTFYNPAMYTHVEGDTIEEVMVAKVKPTAMEVRDAFHLITDEEVLVICDKLEIVATLADLKK